MAEITCGRINDLLPFPMTPWLLNLRSFYRRVCSPPTSKKSRTNLPRLRGARRWPWGSWWWSSQIPTSEVTPPSVSTFHLVARWRTYGVSECVCAFCRRMGALCCVFTEWEPPLLGRPRFFPIARRRFLRIQRQVVEDRKSPVPHLRLVVRERNHRRSTYCCFSLFHLCNSSDSSFTIESSVYHVLHNPPILGTWLCAAAVQRFPWRLFVIHD